MAIRIDETLLVELGLGRLPKPEKDKLLGQLIRTLEERVGQRIASVMSDQQLEEFERFIDSNDQNGALKWLQANYPDHQRVVVEEFDKLKAEIKQDAPRILAAVEPPPSS